MSMLYPDDVTVIADHINKLPHGWKREVTVTTLNRKVRATIARDFYDFQSQIKVEVWSPDALAWNTIRTLDGEDHKDLPGPLCLRIESKTEQDKLEIFEGTRDLVEQLIGYAQEILA